MVRFQSTDGSGNVAFTATFNVGLASGYFISATATDPGNNSSSFALCVSVAGPSVPGGFRVAGLVASSPTVILPTVVAPTSGAPWTDRVDDEPAPRPQPLRAETPGPRVLGARPMDLFFRTVNEDLSYSAEFSGHAQKLPDFSGHALAIG